MIKIILTKEQEEQLLDFLNVKSIIDSEELEVYAPNIGRKIGHFFVRMWKDGRKSVRFKWAQYFRAEIKDKLNYKPENKTVDN